MEHKGIDFVGFVSLVAMAGSVLGLVAVTFGPWKEQPSGSTLYAILSFTLLTFSMLGTLTRNVAAILRTQADQIAALQRELVEQRSRV